MRLSFEIHMIKYDALYINIKIYSATIHQYDTGKERFYLLSSSFFGLDASFFGDAPDDSSGSRSNLTPLQTDHVCQQQQKTSQ
jgi:hypothetical protein